jgi:hypothetical protein
MIVYAPGTEPVNVAVRPLVVSVVAPDGVTLQVTPPVHCDVALTVAVTVTAAPGFTMIGLALALTLLTVQPALVESLPLLHAGRSTIALAAAHSMTYRHDQAPGARLGFV